MSQNDFVIANQTAASARSDINSALQALASNSIGTSAPSTTYAGQFWFDSTNNKLKIRNEANSSWLDFADINSSVIITPGYASQAEAEAGTNNTKFMTPLRVKQATFPSSSLSTNGYIEMAGGLLMQWGYEADTGTSMTIDYPINFNSVVYNVQVSQVSGAANYQNITIDPGYTSSTTSFSIKWDSGPTGINWLAIGV